jgi:hypothetical protein
MALAAPLSPPTRLIPRFALLIEAMKRGLGKRELGESLGRQRQDGPLEPRLSPLAHLLWRYLARTVIRLAALHARFAAGKLPRVPRRSPAPRPAAEGPRPERRPPAIPPGPVLSQFGLEVYADELRALLDDAETRALLAATPQAGRLLRPLWRKLTREPLPEMLRLPRKPRPPRSPAAPTLPGLRLVTVADGTTLWEPIPCYPFSQPPPRTLARAAEPPAPAPAPPPAAPPPAARVEWGRPAPPERPRIPWAMGLFQR